MVLAGAYILLQLIYVAQIACYYYYWNLALQKKQYAAIAKKDHLITIIVVVRNESTHILQCITSLLNQDYPHAQTELIIVDDFSDDNTVELINKLQNTSIKVMCLSEILDQKYRFTANKKMGIELAIKQSNGDIIACTDGDSIVSNSWLSVINQVFQNDEVQYCTGAVLYQNNDSLLEQFQTVDMLSMLGISSASIEMNAPFMSNGANMAYRKAAFTACGGYDKIDHLPTGDDILLMHKIHQMYGKNAIEYVKAASSIVYTTSEKTWSGFYQQRTRWVSKSSSYSGIVIKITLVYMYLYHLSFIALPLLLFIYPSYAMLWIGCFVIKWIVDTCFVNKISRYYNSKYNVLLMPVFETIYIAYVSIIGISATIGNYTWKNRTIKK